MVILNNLEDKSDEIKDPSGYLRVAVDRRLEREGVELGFDIYEKVRKRCMWLNNNVLWHDAIGGSAIEALATLEWPDAMWITRQVENNADSIDKPTPYLIDAVERCRDGHKGGGRGRGGGGRSGDYDAGGRGSKHFRDRGGDSDWERGGSGGGGREDRDRDRSVLHRSDYAGRGGRGQDRWEGQDRDRGDRGDRGRDRERERERYHSRDDGGRERGFERNRRRDHDNGRGGGEAEEGAWTRMRKRCTWLNKNVFWDGAITEDAIRALSEVKIDIAMSITENLESRSDEVKNPNAYLLTGAARHLERRDGKGKGSKGGKDGGKDRKWERGWKGKGKDKGKDKGKGKYKGKGKGKDDLYTRVHRRCTWLNANVFWTGAIEDEAIEALAALDFGLTMDITKELEAMGQEEEDPSGFILSAVEQEYENNEEKYGDEGDGEAQTGHQSAGSGDGGQGDYEKADVDAAQSLDEEAFAKLHARCMWLNENVFKNSAIEEETIFDLAELEFERAMQITNDLEALGDHESSPSDYIRKMIQREFTDDHGQDRMDDEDNTRGGGRRWESSRDSGKRSGSRKDEHGGDHGSDYGGERGGERGERGDNRDNGNERGDRGEGSWGGKGRDDHRDEDRDEGNRGGDQFSDRGCDRDGDRGRDRRGSRGGGHDHGGSASRDVQSRKRGRSPRAESTGVDPKVRKRCDWLNENIFSRNCIDDAAVAALSALPYEQAMNICSELQEKGADRIVNPSAYAQSEISRQRHGSHSGDERSPVQRSRRVGKGKGRSGNKTW
eukprot:TRINITY_DN4013_c1_g1_i1.p1 TRINITY_DN4013_c1_g1~~TRINITY_DN4013_c1_g1_i1.p1  ORF type:complete len:857 (+),score=179.96 TRINITY_DN4013_c1_g1_i1:232-2571(+)